MVGVEFLELDLVARRVPPMIVRAMNRRTSNRARMAAEERSDVFILPIDAASDAPALVGKIFDVSTGGIGVFIDKSVTIDAIPVRMRVWFCLPQIKEPISAFADQRGMFLVEKKPKLGVEFDAVESPNFENQKRVIARFVNGRLAANR